MRIRKVDMLRKVKLYGTTDSSGDLTVTSTHPVLGILYAIQWIDGSFVDGVDAVFSFTQDGAGADKTIETLTDANDDTWYYPLVQSSDVSGGAVASEYRQEIVDGYLKMVVSSGGDTKTGGAILYFQESI